MIKRAARAGRDIKSGLLADSLFFFNLQVAHDAGVHATVGPMRTGTAQLCPIASREESRSRSRLPGRTASWTAAWPETTTTVTDIDHVRIC
jgi:hypothetical protein